MASSTSPGAKLSGSDAGDRLDVSCQAFLGPMMVAFDGAEREVYHLVGHDPIVSITGDIPWAYIASLF